MNNRLCLCSLEPFPSFHSQAVFRIPIHPNRPSPWSTLFFFFDFCKLEIETRLSFFLFHLSEPSVYLSFFLSHKQRTRMLTPENINHGKRMTIMAHYRMYNSLPLFQRNRGWSMPWHGSLIRIFTCFCSDTFATPSPLRFTTNLFFFFVSSAVLCCSLHPTSSLLLASPHLIHVTALVCVCCSPFFVLVFPLRDRRRDQRLIRGGSTKMVGVVGTESETETERGSGAYFHLYL